MEINPSLFGHIQNDAFLSGNYNLEAHLLSDTIAYLQNYLEKKSSTGLHAKYRSLLEDLKFLVTIEERVQTPLPLEKINGHIKTLSQDIYTKMEALSPGKRLLIPGGWLDEAGGHSMVYEIIRKENGYYFIVYNSGDGIEYHGKKSTKEKELYNPTKTWFIPLNSKSQNSEEVKLFLARLLKARFKTDEIQSPMSAKVLYEELFPSISNAGGYERNIEAPAFAYTAGQFSGSCSQRVLHQMLKFQSTSLLEYQAFIFEFKLFALNDYCQRCSTGLEPFNSAVAEQIQLAIENNLKILNSDDLFNEEQTNLYSEELIELRKRINALPLPKPAKAAEVENYYSYFLLEQKLASQPLPVGTYHFHPPPDGTINFTADGFLAQLEEYLLKIKNINDPALHYIYLEKLLLALPLYEASTSPYNQLSSIKNLEVFYQQIEEIQTVLDKLKKTWVKDTHLSNFNILVLNTLSLQTDVQNALAKEKGLPSFQAFANQSLETIIGNNKRNPFWATYNPKMDQRFLELQKKYTNQKRMGDNEFYAYFTELLNTRPLLNEKLKKLFIKDYGHHVEELYNQIRTYGLESLYILSLHINGSIKLDDKFEPLVEQLKAHIAYEAKLRTHINPFFSEQYKEDPYISLEMVYNTFRISSPLYPAFVPFQVLTQDYIKKNYSIPLTAVKKALEIDVPSHSVYLKPIQARSANNIQLQSELNTEANKRPIERQDIAARIYFHLRSNPKIQIPLSLDYFKRNKEKLAESANRLYLEANIFQPGLLLKAIKRKDFFTLFDDFLEYCYRFFTMHGQHTPSSLYFLKLNILVSNYLLLTDKEEGIKRLKLIENELQKQILNSSDPELTYSLYYYLFLSMVEKINTETYSEEDLEHTLNAYFYLQSHSKPSLLEENNQDKNRFDCLVATFQACLVKQQQINPANFDSLVKKIVLTGNNLFKGYTFKSQFPFYELLKPEHPSYQFNAVLGKLYEKNFCHSELPFAIKNHPLIKDLQLSQVDSAYCSADGYTFHIVKNNKKTQIFFHENNLTIQQYWNCDEEEHLYELQALSPAHLALYANKNLSPVPNNLPAVLRDTQYNFWRRTDIPNEGLLVKNNKAIYKVSANTITLLDENGLSTPFSLKPLSTPWASTLTHFECTQFILHHQHNDVAYVDLPRFNLHFARKENTLVLVETNEELVKCPFLIHPSVASLVLKKAEHQRVIIPIARFYATVKDAQTSRYYPIVHDREGILAKNHHENNLKHLLHPPLWNYQNSECYVSFRIKNNEPIADNPADALYLAYIYLSTHQTEKAWVVLEDCRTRLGGLTGTADELKYISWICNDLPHILIGQEQKTKRAHRKSPPYIACKLKALSLLCDSLSQEKNFKPILPKNPSNTANYYWEQKQYDDQVNFLDSLNLKIYSYFTRYQAMRRHLEASYNLSAIERKRLLNHYQQSNYATQGALGYEWMLLNLESVQQEYQSLLTLKKINALSEDDEQRLKDIEKSIASLKPIHALSSSLQLKPINLNLPDSCSIKQAHLSKEDIEVLNTWINKLPGQLVTEDQLKDASSALSSSISEASLIAHFPTYLQLALGDESQQKKTLFDFCKRTLIAQRYIPWEKHTTNRALLCNILYRVATNTVEAKAVKPFYSFNHLVSFCKKFKTPSLSAYQLVDEYKDILSTPKDILDQSSCDIALTVLPFKNSVPSLIQQIDKDTRLERFINQYHHLIQHYKLTQEEFLQKIDTQPQHLSEIQAGSNQLKFEQQKIGLAQKLMNDQETWRQLGELIEIEVPKRHLAFLELEREALGLANEGPEDKKRKRSWLIEQAAKKRKHLDKADLNSLYLKADLNFTIKITGLNKEKAQKLHELIHATLTQGIHYQIAKKIQNAIQKSFRSQAAEDLVPALDLLAKKIIPGLELPAIVLLQHEEGIILRTRQVSALKTLLQTNSNNFKETVEKIIPGGGKSKVIIPIVAEEKAKGSNLIIVEVPQALLATNYVDLNRVSQRLFGKTAYRFDFNRESDCSAKRLESIYNKFKEVMTTRSYLVCAGESMQSLELKYLELLFSEPPHDKEWEKQIYWCDKLVNLIRHHGEAIIDEVHQGLWIKKKLNYTIGEQKPLSISIINNAIALFQFIDPEFIKTAPLLNEDYDWTSFQHQLANKLLTEVTSPLHNYVKFIEKESGAAAIKDLFSYLTNTANCETLLAKAPADCKAALAFFKQQINSVLPATLTRRLNTNYGASKKENLSAIEQTHAIPYEANNIANERSRFGNNLEAMNYACQMLFIKGVSKELLQEHLKQIQAIARQELFKNKQFRFLDETPTAQGFALLWPDLGLNLSQIKPEDKKQLSEIHQRLKNNKALILEILQQHSLKLIPRDGSIIHSDSFNHVDLYHSVQAVSGTPSNHTTYHQRLAFDRKASLGTDGYIIQLLQHKKTAIKAIDYQNLTQFVPDLLAQSPTHCRAIIDIRAAFQGIENLSVAKELAAYIKKQKKQFSTPLKHVLYFNEQQILCALDINKPNTPIILKTTDVNELNRILGSTPNERFTYFDQVHTLGTDLTQDEHAHALVLVDEKTSLQSFLQGSMRMRGLGEKQSIEIITPTKLSGITSTELINKFSKAESQTLLMDNLFAAKGQMTNLLRRHCLDQIEKLPSDWVKTKATLAQRFKTFFVHDASQDLFELYGAISKKQPTKQILEQHKKQLLNRYLHTFTAETVPLSEITLNKINLELDKLITKALGCCLEEYEHGVIDLAVEVEAQKEIQKQSQIQIASINEFFDPHLKESKPVEWETLSLNSLYSKQQEIDKCSLLVNSLAAPKEKPGFLFSEHLRVSRSYAQTHTKQQKYLDAFLKPASVIWYYKEASILRAMIITPQDLEGLYKHIANTPNNWVSTTEGTVLCGEQPKGIQATKTYQSLRDQVRFFNGEFNAFLEPEGNSEWLNEAVSPKLQFFEESLLPYRPDCEKKFQELKTLLTQASIEGFAYIAEHPHQDLTRFNWQSLFPETSPAQGEEYRKMAAAFVSIQAQWQNNIPQLNNVQEQFRLPLKCLSYVNSHLLDLKKLSNLLENIRRASLSLGNLVLNPEEQVLLEFYLNKPLKEFYIPQQNNACAFIDLLEQLYTHPAFNNKRDLGQNLQRMAQVSTSVEVLLKILDSKNLNTEVLTSILYSPIKDPGITNKLLELPLSLFSEDMLALFFMRCNEEQHINILLKKADLPPLLLKLILDKYPNEAFILNLLEQTKNYHVLEIIYQKFQNIKSVRQAIYQHPALTSTSLLAITNLHLFFDEKELTELLINSKAPIDALILSAIGINSPYNESLFLIIAKHPKANPQVIESLLNHPQCRPQLIQKIMNIKGSNIEYETLKTIVRKVYNYTVYFSSKGDREEWEHCCLKGFKALNHFANTKADVSSNDNSSFISSLISSFDLILHPQFAIKILKIFKQGVSLKLPFESMINDASFEELKILIDYKYTGPLSDPILEQLYKKLSTPELFDLFTKRPDLSPRLSLKLVSNMDISEEQLQTVIANSPQEKVLEAAFLHPKTSAEGKKNISEALARSKILSSPYVAPVQENQTMQQQYLKTKFLSAVEQLKLKAEAHAMKTKTNPLFEENAKKTAALHKKILANQEQIFKGNTAVINSLMLAIKDASPTLATHRGYKEVIYDVLNLLLNIVTFGLKSRTTGDWRFFKPKTDSLLLVEEIKKCMEPFNPVQVSSLELN